MSKCNKSKNPCKICLSPVTHRSGLQCQGTCQSWVHYTCLNYTPGKIKDIKAGIIKVTCPCPDCKTTTPKEFRTDTAYSCNNSMCPANLPPKCENMECPTNSCGRPILVPPPCPLSKCGNKCKQFSSPHLPGNAAGAQCPPKPCMVDKAESSSNSCMKPSSKCASGCSSTNNVSGDFGVKPQNFNVVERMCNTVDELSTQIKELMNQMKQVNQGSGGGGGGAQPGVCPAKMASKGPREAGAKPCYCPGNPARQM